MASREEIVDAVVAMVQHTGGEVPDEIAEEVFAMLTHAYEESGAAIGNLLNSPTFARAVTLFDDLASAMRSAIMALREHDDESTVEFVNKVHNSAVAEMANIRNGG